LFASPDIIRVIKSRTMKWVVHVVRVGEMSNTYKILVGKPEGKSGHSEDVSVDGKVILDWILEKSGGNLWTGCVWVTTGTSGWLL
jgi:hypothetical protein